MAKARTRAANLPVPQDRDEAAAMLREVGDRDREITRLETAMNDELAAIKQRYEALAAPIKEARVERVEGLRIWAEANRQQLTQGKTKTVDLGTGKVSWRMRPPSVRIARGVAESIVQTLRTLGLERFVRTKEEVNREAMQAEPEVARQVQGITIGSAGEDFVVEPFEAELSDGAAT